MLSTVIHNLQLITKCINFFSQIYLRLFHSFKFIYKLYLYFFMRDTESFQKFLKQKYIVSLINNTVIKNFIFVKI